MRTRRRGRLPFWPVSRPCHPPVVAGLPTVPPAVPRLHFVRPCPGYAANALGDVGGQAAGARGVLSVYDRPCPPLSSRRAKAGSDPGGPRAVLSANGQRLPDARREAGAACTVRLAQVGSGALAGTDLSVTALGACRSVNRPLGPQPSPWAPSPWASARKTVPLGQRETHCTEQALEGRRAEVPRPAYSTGPAGRR